MKTAFEVIDRRDKAFNQLLTILAAYNQDPNIAPKQGESYWALLRKWIPDSMKSLFQLLREAISDIKTQATDPSLAVELLNAFRDYVKTLEELQETGLENLYKMNIYNEHDQWMFDKCKEQQEELFSDRSLVSIIKDSQAVILLSEKKQNLLNFMNALIDFSQNKPHFFDSHSAATLRESIIDKIPNEQEMFAILDTAMKEFLTHGKKENKAKILFTSLNAYIESLKKNQDYHLNFSIEGVILIVLQNKIDDMEDDLVSETIPIKEKINVVQKILLHAKNGSQGKEDFKEIYEMLCMPTDPEEPLTQIFNTQDKAFLNTQPERLRWQTLSIFLTHWQEKPVQQENSEAKKELEALRDYFQDHEKEDDKPTHPSKLPPMTFKKEQPHEEKNGSSKMAEKPSTKKE